MHDIYSIIHSTVKPCAAKDMFNVFVNVVCVSVQSQLSVNSCFWHIRDHVDPGDSRPPYSQRRCRGLQTSPHTGPQSFPRDTLPTTHPLRCLSVWLCLHACDCIQMASSEMKHLKLSNEFTGVSDHLMHKHSWPNTSCFFARRLTLQPVSQLLPLYFCCLARSGVQQVVLLEMTGYWVNGSDLDFWKNYDILGNSYF